MKKLCVNICRFFTIIALLAFSSCSLDDDDNNTPPPGNQQAILQIQGAVQTGQWRITNFIDSGQDELYHFTGYTFDFQQNGTLVATNGTNTYNGTWSITDSDSNDDDDDSNDSSDIDFNINFNETNAFEDLNDDWDIFSVSASKLELLDVSGGDGETDYLTFERI